MSVTDFDTELDNELLRVFDCVLDCEIDILIDAKMDELTLGDPDVVTVCTRVFVCEAEIDGLFVSDFEIEGVMVGEAPTDEDADGQPKPRVHVGLEENDVPNDFVVVPVDV